MVIEIFDWRLLGWGTLPVALQLIIRIVVEYFCGGDQEEERKLVQAQFGFWLLDRFCESAEVLRE